MAAPPAPVPPAAVRTIVMGVLLAMLLASLNQTIVTTALPTLGRTLGDPAATPWVVAAYLVAATAVTPLYGKLSDIHGRRLMLSVAVCLFVVGAIACALAPTMLALIAARTLQGLGGGGLMALSQTIIADVVAPKERPRYQVYTSIVFVSASLAGPMIGGLIVDHLHWSLIFWLNVPLGVLALWRTYTALRLLPRHERPHKLDAPGALLMVGATVALMLALSWGGRRYPWASVEIIGLIGGSLLGWALFFRRLRTAEEPLIPLDVFDSPLVRSGVVAASLGMGSFIAFLTYAPTYLETARRLTPANSGLALMPLMAGEVVGALIAGRVIARFVHYKRAPMIGLLCSMAAAAAIAIDPAAIPLPAVIALMAVISIGLGTILPVTTLSVQNAVAQHQMGVTTGALNFFRQLSASLLVAVFGAILFQGAADPSTLHDAAAVAAAFRWICLATSAGFAGAWLFLSRMEARPLRSGKN
jgi:EmrB/QacA subfamily drug resistance transporter